MVENRIKHARFDNQLTWRCYWTMEYVLLSLDGRASSPLVDCTPSKQLYSPRICRQSRDYACATYNLHYRHSSDIQYTLPIYIYIQNNNNNNNNSDVCRRTGGGLNDWTFWGVSFTRWNWLLIWSRRTVRDKPLYIPTTRVTRWAAHRATRPLYRYSVYTYMTRNEKIGCMTDGYKRRVRKNNIYCVAWNLNDNFPVKAHHQCVRIILCTSHNITKHTRMWPVHIIIIFSYE